jgi:ATP-dependent protease ClpP protease subunit
MAPKNQHVFRCSDLINEKMYNRFKQFCEHIPVNLPDQKLYFYIMSIGGDLGWASKIVSLINELSNIEIVTVGYYKVHSSAIAIFAAGDLRLARTRDVKFLFHLPTKEVETVSEKDLHKSQESVFGFIAERIGRPVEEINELAARETYLSAEDAEKIGLVHQILE